MDPSAVSNKTVLIKCDGEEDEENDIYFDQVSSSVTKKISDSNYNNIKDNVSDILIEAIENKYVPIAKTLNKTNLFADKNSVGVSFNNTSLFLDDTSTIYKYYRKNVQVVRNENMKSNLQIAKHIKGVIEKIMKISSYNVGPTHSNIEALKAELKPYCNIVTNETDFIVREKDWSVSYRYGPYTNYLELEDVVKNNLECKKIYKYSDYVTDDNKLHQAVRCNSIKYISLKKTINMKYSEVFISKDELKEDMGINE